MYAETVSHRMAFFPIWMLLCLGLAVTVVLIAAFSRRLPGPTIAMLVIGAVFGVTFSVGAVRWSAARHAHDATPRLETRPFVPEIVPSEREIVARATMDLIPLPDRSRPVEAARPSVTDLAIARGDEYVAATSSLLPDWTKTRAVTEGDRQLVVVRSEQFADPATAWQQAISEATERVRHNFDEFSHQARNSWTLDPETVRSRAVRKSFTERIDRSAGENEFTVYRTYLLVELSPDVRTQIEPIWRQQVSHRRSISVAALFGLLTVVAGVFAGYFRLDDRTHGRYRWRLRLAALGLIGLTLVATGTASDAVQRRPDVAPSTPVDLPVTPSDARMPPLEVRVDHQDQERFRQVADRVVQAINAADYEGVRQDFDENMLDKFPVETCRTFFTTKISDKYGKIDTLEPPQFKSAAVAVFVARCQRGTLDFTLVLDKNGQVAGMLFRPRSGALPVSCG